MLQKDDIKQLSEFMTLLLSSESINICTKCASIGCFHLIGENEICFEDIRRRYPLVDLYVHQEDGATNLYWRAVREVGVQRHVKVFATYQHHQNKLLLHPPLAKSGEDLHIDHPFSVRTHEEGELKIGNCLNAAQIAALREKLHYQNVYHSGYSRYRPYSNQ